MNRTEDTTAEAASLRADIDEQRANMSRTVGAIEERLSPAHIKEQLEDVKEAAVAKVDEVKHHAKSAVHDATIGRVDHMARQAKDTVTGAGTTILQTIKDNPIPAAMIALGLGWMFVNRGSGTSTRRMGSYGYAEGGAERRDVLEGARGLAQRAGERVSEITEEARETGHRAVRDVERRARTVEARFGTVMHENPLVVGAVALALGAAAGLVIPRTRMEDEWMGEAKDKLIERAQGVARGAIATVEQKVEALGAGEENRREVAEPAGVETGIGEEESRVHV